MPPPMCGRRRRARRFDCCSLARHATRPDLAVEQRLALGVEEGRLPLAATVSLALDQGETEAMIGAAVAHLGAADLLPREIAVDLAGEQRAAGAEHELGAALVGKA